MDPNISSQPTQTETPPQQPVNKIPSSGSKWKLILLKIILLPIAGLGLYSIGGLGAYYLGAYLLETNNSKPQPIAQVIVFPTPVPDPTADWKTYVSTKYNFSVKYPSNLEADDQQTAPPSVLFQSRQRPGAPGFPALYVSVISDPPNQSDLAYNRFSQEDLSKLFATKVGGAVVLGTLNPPYSDYWNFKRLSDLAMNGMIGQVFENSKVWEGEKDLKDRRVLIKKNRSIYIIGAYYKTTEDLHSFNLFLSTFKFTGQNQTPHISADVFIQTYYNSYLVCLTNHFNNPTGKSLEQDCPYDVNIFTPTLYSQLQNGLIYAKGNPILCAQNIPQSLTFDNAIISADEQIASIVVHTVWGSNAPGNINVGLQKISEQWKISSINCNK